MSVIGQGVADGFLSEAQIAGVVRDGLGQLAVDGKRVLVLIPDGTRTMPMAMMFDAIDRELGPRVAALDFLIALGTHTPMNDEQMTRLIGRPVVNGLAGKRRIFNHRWDDPSAFVTLGVIPAYDVAEISRGRLNQDVPVALNRLVLDYDHILICGPVFPHEVVGFSGGTKYLFPGIAAADIIHFTHWLGALITSTTVIGTMDTPVRAMIDRAAALLPTPVSVMALVVTHEGVAGMFCGGVHEAWRRAAALSARRHIVWLEKPLKRVLAVMPALYDDLWTAGKGTYKTEPAVADGGEVIIFAPHVPEVSYVHGKLIDEVGYHCRDYFLAQWPRFERYPGGILAHSTHVKGLGAYDVSHGIETPRIQVTLATGIPAERCTRINLRYLDPESIDVRDWSDNPNDDAYVVPRAGEVLFRVGHPPTEAEVALGGTE
jgi:nickel-dependent lactate racemase